MPNNEKFYIKFFAPVIPQTVGELMKIVDDKIKAGKRELGLLISTPGGDVFQGLSAYNFLKGAPIKVTTHNFGSADSIGAVLFCAGEKRYSVPQARFLIHGVTCNFPGPVMLEEKQLEERLKGLQIDMGNIARVIAAATGKNHEEIIKDMINRTTLYPEQAITYGLVHEIKTELFALGDEVISIPFPQKGPGELQLVGNKQRLPIMLQ
jgi:ATP-dependent Clp protease, protease subunit